MIVAESVIFILDCLLCGYNVAFEIILACVRAPRFGPGQLFRGRKRSKKDLGPLRLRHVRGPRHEDLVGDAQGQHARELGHFGGSKRGR